MYGITFLLEEQVEGLSSLLCLLLICTYPSSVERVPVGQQWLLDSLHLGFQLFAFCPPISFSRLKKRRCPPPWSLLPILPSTTPEPTPCRPLKLKLGL